MKKTFEMMKDEYWYGGAVECAKHMPFSQSSDFELDLTVNPTYNQASPLFVSSKGRYIWNEDGYRIEFRAGNITIWSEKEIEIVQAGKTLRDAYCGCQAKFFPANGKFPNEMMFETPQYCTWIELMYDQNENDILQYAEDIVAAGIPAGELIIDDCWQEDYGIWKFHPGRFRNPKRMVDRLHELGFKVILWICPFVSADTKVFRDQLEKENIFVKNPDGEISVKKWWNGYSAVLDLSNPAAREWFLQRTQWLMDTYGVDGFKQDAGDAFFYDSCDVTYCQGSPNRQSELWAELAEKFPFNEVRACFKNGGKGIAQRLCDKFHNWSIDNGLGSLVPNALIQGILGYPFTCADMIGGGLWTDFLEKSKIDEELFVRSAQASSCMPMMQFSYAVWKHLSPKMAKLCMQAVHFRKEVQEYLIECVHSAARTGEPIVRMMEYNFPGCGYEMEMSQFMLGMNYVVAPIVKKAANKHRVILPQGTWRLLGTDLVFEGNQELLLDVALEMLPIFGRADT